MEAEGQEYVTTNVGVISFPTLAERRTMCAPYLDSTTFSLYRDRRPPIVRGKDDGARSPDDIAFGPDGSAYWTDIAHGTVTRRSPDGTHIVVAELGPGVNPITFSDDGRLFVLQCFMDDKLYEVDPAGTGEARLISGDLGPGCGLNGMDWGSADGKLYGPRWFEREVVRVDVETGEVETVAVGFGVPAAVKFDSQGRLHVLDDGALRGIHMRGTLHG